MLGPPSPLVYHKSKGRKNNSSQNLMVLDAYLSQNLVVLDTPLSQNPVDFDGQFSHFLIFRH